MTAPGSPLQQAPSPAHLAQLRQAKDLGKKIQRAVLVAKISGWSIAVFGGLTLLGGLADAATFVLGVAMSVIAVVELRNGALLKRLQTLALNRLALNQLAFAVVLIAYAAWHLFTSSHGPGLLSEYPELGQSGVDVSSLEQTVYLSIFFGIVLAALLGPGLTAIYYATRRKWLDAYLRDTPAWILELQRAGMDL